MKNERNENKNRWVKAMKKIAVAALLLAAVALLLSACSGGGSENGGNAPGGDPVSTGEVTDGKEPYRFKAASANLTISVDDDIAAVLEALGEPKSYFEAPSCAFNGLDKTYTWSGFTVTTRPETAGDLISSILLTDDSVTTAEGAYIGMSGSQITSLYGTPSEETSTLLAYRRGGMCLQFVLRDGNVISIEYLSE